MPEAPKPRLLGRRKTEEEHLTALTERVKKTFVRERRLFERKNGHRSGLYQPHPRWDQIVDRDGGCKSMWRAIAEFMMQEKLDPDDYVMRVFELQDRRSKVDPSHLIGLELVMKCHEHFQENLRRISGLYQDDYLCFRTEFAHRKAALRKSCGSGADGELSGSKKENIRSILLDGSVPLGALFRFCTAMRFDMEDIADGFRKSAAWYYCRYKREYSRVYRGFIPTGFLREARKIYRDLLDREGLEDTSPRAATRSLMGPLPIGVHQEYYDAR